MVTTTLTTTTNIPPPQKNENKNTTSICWAPSSWLFIRSVYWSCLLLSPPSVDLVYCRRCYSVWAGHPAAHPGRQRQLYLHGLNSIGVSTVVISLGVQLRPGPCRTVLFSPLRRPLCWPAGGVDGGILLEWFAWLLLRSGYCRFFWLAVTLMYDLAVYV